MAQTTGIAIEHTSKGIPIYAHIDLRKHADIIPFLERKGIQIEKKKISGTSKCPSGYLTHEQFVEQCNNEIDNFCLKP